MSFTQALLQEAREALLGWAFLTLVVTIVLAKALPGAGHKRLPSSLYLFGMQLVVLFVSAGLVATDHPMKDTAQIAHRVLLALAWVSTVAALVFGVLLSRTRVKLARIVQDLIVAGAMVFVVAIVLNQHGVALAGLFATSAVITAVIGLSLQDTLGNTIGGLALQTDGSIRVGDWVKVGDITGRVVEIRWRYTGIETRNGETVLLPNSVLMKGPVMILGRREATPDVRYWRRWVKFNVDFRYPPSDVIDSVVKALRSQPLERVAAEPKPDCILLDLHESYATYAVRYWLTDLQVDDPTDSLVRTRVIFALKRAEIPLSIPAHAIFVTEENRKRKEAKFESEHKKRLDALKKVELFNPLDDAELDALADSLRFAPFSRGELVTKQGADAHWLYLVIDGDVAVRLAKDGHEQEVARMGPGSFFGEMGLLTGEKRSATVVALTDVECYRLDDVSFKALVQRRPEVVAPIAALLAERRANLARVEGDLSAEARARNMAADGDALLSRMRQFLGF